MTANHRGLYPEQYQHAMCGKRVRIQTSPGRVIEFTIKRVLQTQFGELVNLPTTDLSGQTAVFLSDLEIIE